MQDFAWKSSIIDSFSLFRKLKPPSTYGRFLYVMMSCFILRLSCLNSLGTLVRQEWPLDFNQSTFKYMKSNKLNFEFPSWVASTYMAYGWFHRVALKKICSGWNRDRDRPYNCLSLCWNNRKSCGKSAPQPFHV